MNTLPLVLIASIVLVVLYLAVRSSRNNPQCGTNAYTGQPKPRPAYWRWGLGVLLLLVAGGATISFITNRNLPTAAMNAAQLFDLDKAHLSEIAHLRHSLGNAVWPGWGDADIPLIVYNDAHAFLIGYANPPVGWRKVPQNAEYGGPWLPVPDDNFQGSVYYRTRLPDDGRTPEAFTVLVGDFWAASLPTRPAMRVMMAHEFRTMLPDSVADILPYALAADLFLRNSDSYVAGMLHESFHAYQGMQAPERLAAAEWAAIRQGDAYPYREETFVADWQTELDLLQAALRAEDESETAVLVQQFLVQRNARRVAANLSPVLVTYEQQREWLEGMALYIELSILRQAYLDNEYRPVAALAAAGLLIWTRY